MEFAQARALAENVIERYRREEIDAVYIVFNEFKSVIAQRLIVEQILPIEQIGEPAVRLVEEMTEEEKKRAKEAAISAGVGLRGPDRHVEEVASQVWHVASGLHLRAAAGGVVPRAACRST